MSYFIIKWRENLQKYTNINIISYAVNERVKVSAGHKYIYFIALSRQHIPITVFSTTMRSQYLCQYNTAAERRAFHLHHH